uniref:Cytochrome b5 domain containing 1 n=1 Tax=Ornithorhynchus anatinus TaxID=9258 RepID=A0A6I8P8W5_ORNAN
MYSRGLVAGPDLEHFRRRYFTPWEVGTEESLWEILHRYLPHNAHAASYTWKCDGVSLDMNKTLEQNGIHDEDHEFQQLSMDTELYTPALLLYFNDDLTEL